MPNRPVKKNREQHTRTNISATSDVGIITDGQSEW